MATDTSLRDAQDLELPFTAFGVALVHAEEIGGKQARFITTGTGTHFQYGVLGIGLILRQQHDLYFTHQFRQASLQFALLLFGQGAHFFVVVLKHNLKIVQL